jgi:hypothetical protein
MILPVLMFPLQILQTALLFVFSLPVKIYVLALSHFFSISLISWMHFGHTQAPMGFVFSPSFHFPNTLKKKKRPGVAKLFIHWLCRQLLSLVSKIVKCRRHGSNLLEAIVLIMHASVPGWDHTGAFLHMAITQDAGPLPFAICPVFLEGYSWILWSLPHLSPYSELQIFILTGIMEGTRLLFLASILSERRLNTVWSLETWFEI